MRHPLEKSHCASIATIGLAFALVAGCGGGAATMHPAHTLPSSRVTVGAGMSGHFVLGEADDAIDQGRSVGAQGVASTGNAEQELIDGAVANAMVSPGIAPWVGARVGLGSNNEAGLTYTGRTVRADGRHAFENDSVALSVGGGLSIVLLHPGSRPPPEDPGQPGTVGRIDGDVDDLNATGWGLDVPVIVGFRSDGELFQVWTGARGGFERVSGDLPIVPNTATPLNEPGSEVAAPVDGQRWHVGGLAGLAVGLHPIWVALQFDAAYQSVSGSVEFPAGGTDPSVVKSDVSGLSLTPTGAIIGKF